MSCRICELQQKVKSGEIENKWKRSMILGGDIVYNSGDVAIAIKDYGVEGHRIWFLQKIGKYWIKVSEEIVNNAS